MVIGMVSCGSDSGSDDEDEDEVTSSAAAEEEESEAEGEDGESEAESEESEAETEESAAETDSDTGYADGVYTGSGYTISVDESLWEYTEQASTDCAFSYIGEGDELVETANLNVVSMSADSLAGTSPADYADSIKSAYDSMDGYTVTADSEGELNGYTTYNLTVEYVISDYTMIIDQVIISSDDTLVAISYGAFDSVMETVEPEFDKILSTFKFN
jgi:hypothetical protein